MRIGCVQEAWFPRGVTLAERYAQMVEEAILAEECGFDFYCLSEQHFGFSTADLVERSDRYHAQRSGAVSAPECFLPFIAARTEAIKLRTTSIVLLPFNHPVRVAERIATLDVLSNGRIEIGTARSNNLGTLRAFGVDPKHTKQIWRESLGLIINALVNDYFEHEGEVWSFARTPLTPKPIQLPHPPMFVSASSVGTHREAGELGLGAMTGSSILGWDYVAEVAAAYVNAIPDPQPLSGVVNNSLGLYATRVHCAATEEQAKDEVRDGALAFVDINIGPGGRYEQLGPTSPDYAYLQHIHSMQEHMDDLDYLMDASPYVMAGTPDFLIERIKRLERMGYTEILLGIEGMSHEMHKSAIEMIGEYVIPEFRASAERAPETRTAI